MTRQFQLAGYMRLLIWNVTNMGPVKPGLMVRTITLKFYLNLHENCMKMRLRSSFFVLHLWPHGLLLGKCFVYPSVVCPCDLTTGGTGHRSGDWSSFPQSPGESPGSVKDTGLPRLKQGSPVLVPGPAHLRPHQTSDTTVLPADHPLPLVGSPEGSGWRRPIRILAGGTNPHLCL